MSRGRIRIADDETTYLTSAAELLRRGGFTLDTVEETKGAFKSKTLGDSRHKLELVLEHV